MAGSENLQFGKSYFNEANQPFTIDLFQFYVSNLKLKAIDGSITILPSTYFIVNENNNTVITVPNISIGSYSNLSFMLGVDSVKNVSGTQTGALDPVKNIPLFLTGNSG